MVIDDDNRIGGFLSIGGSIGIGVGGGFGFGIVTDYNPLARTIYDIKGFGHSFSADVATPVFSGSLSAGMDGTISLSAGKKTKLDSEISASINYNAGYTFLIPLEKVRSKLLKLKNGKNLFESMKREIWKLKGK